MARVVVITAARLSAGRARQREKCPRARRPIEPGELHAVLASTGDAKAERPALRAHLGAVVRRAARLARNTVILFFVIQRGVRQLIRADLTEQVHQAIEMPRKESDVVVCAIFDSIVRALRSGDKVEIRGFGSFHTRQRRARIGRNPKTGAKVEVPPKRIPFFKPSKDLRELLDRT